MKLAIVGSRNISGVNIEEYLPGGIEEIVSGGARGIDSVAAAYAKAHGIKLVEFLPDYKKYGRVAPLRRNDEIADYADEVIAFWDGVSSGTKYTVEAFKKRGKPVRIMKIKYN
jgi:predicted Rossmann fold nucleotide-binding protein DprA/Smf involved in DNA uptake